MKKILVAVFLSVVVLVAVVLVVHSNQQNTQKVVDDSIQSTSSGYQEEHPSVVSKTQTVTEQSEPMYLVVLTGNFINGQQHASYLSFTKKKKDGYVWALRAYNTEVAWEK